MLTSPISPSTRRRQPNSFGKAIQHGYASDDFVASDDEVEYEEDAFEIMRDTRGGRDESPGGGVGPPIAIDERMAKLPEIHREVIEEFVQEARRLEEKLRNEAGTRKPFFTDTHFREMAAQWITTQADMREIPDVNQDRVQRYGTRFIALVSRHEKRYNDMMNTNPDQDNDANHQNVIDLVTDDEDEESDEEEIDSDTEKAMAQAERSRFFEEGGNAPSRKGSKRGALPWDGGEPKASGARGRTGSFRRRGKGKGKKSYSARTSYGSSTSGVSKRSAAPKKSRARKTSAIEKFAYSGGRGGGNSGGGQSIGMMPA